jgi:hypothetical protein
MSWFRLAAVVALVAAALLLRARGRAEVWHHLPDRDRDTGP